MKAKEIFMVRKTVVFDTGIQVDFEDEKISMRAQAMNLNQFIDAESLDNFSFHSVYLPQKTILSLWFRVILFTMLLLVVEVLAILVFTGEFLSGSFLGGLVIIYLTGFIPPAYLVVAGIDILIGTNFISGIIEKYYSIQAYLVTIGNKSGNNIAFYANFNEKEKITMVQKECEQIKSESKMKAVKNDAFTISSSSNLNELKKLGNLFKDGIISQDEFDKKKAQLLMS